SSEKRVRAGPPLRLPAGWREHRKLQPRSTKSLHRRCFGLAHPLVKSRQGRVMTTSTSATGTAQPHAFDDAEKAAACSVTDRIDAAWNANDGDGFADVFTSDGSLALSGDRYYKGREDIRTHVKEQFAGPHKGTRLVQNIVDFMFIGPQAAVVTTEGGVLAP